MKDLRSAAIPARPVCSASSREVCPITFFFSSRFWSSSAPMPVRIALAIPSSSFSTAMWSAELQRPRPVIARSAPLSSSSLSTSTLERCAAMRSGVSMFRRCMFTSAPASSSTFTTSRCPRLTATWSGASPFLRVGAFTSAPSAISRFTSSRSPPAAANSSGDVLCFQISSSSSSSSASSPISASPSSFTSSSSPAAGASCPITCGAPPRRDIRMPAGRTNLSSPIGATPDTGEPTARSATTSMSARILDFGR
mmetsp:Transcript_55803/g.131970  ORF Transcript_55803/g.131970 Transcript_55803/m.131970 type:complete len:253 (+) Transcript_55803:467-1225(+)